jgi:hypothetical protein
MRPSKLTRSVARLAYRAKNFAVCIHFNNAIVAAVSHQEMSVAHQD